MRNIPLKESHYANAINKEIAGIQRETIQLSRFLAVTEDCPLTGLFLRELKERRDYLCNLLKDYETFDYYVNLFGFLGFGKTKMFEISKINRDTFYKRISRRETITAHLSQIKATYQQIKNAQNP